MEIVQFREKYRQAFIDFNTEWIVSNFGKLEKQDIESFENIDEEIADGAMIFFAVEGEVPLACCMARPAEGNAWEICKMGTNSAVPHQGAGSAVFKAAMQWALINGAGRMFIISNSRLKAAMHIYEKYGFKEVKLNDYGYDRGDIAFEYTFFDC